MFPRSPESVNLNKFEWARDKKMSEVLYLADVMIRR